MSRLISSCCADRPLGSLATSISSTSEGSSPRSSRGASRSATTTSASMRALRPATAMSSGSPGPPPTSVTPGVWSRWSCARIFPSRSPSRISSRTAAERRGSRLPSTATVTPACRPTAGVQALARVASSARTQKIRRASAPALTCSLTVAVVGRRDDVPGALEVGVDEAARLPADLAVTGQPLDRRCHRRRDQQDVGPGRDQLRDPALGDVAAAHDEHAPSTEPQPGGVRRLLVHPSIIAVLRARVGHVRPS